jgi:hypothetical protein
MKQRNFEVEEGAAIVLRFENGIVGIFVLNDRVTCPWSFEQGTGENPIMARNSARFFESDGRQGKLECRGHEEVEL